ncbi:unnamed protein product [Fusarium graminearum]|uniref:Carboxypeptidase M14A n=1 Tax=Gibberella zeae (strain ATCC MYA-4620 / CBS 123657 / FGSC 9075 / NRRL 31084 / PH-1) TaxID=229533 RepID=I1RIN3_GIBZE|nr:hypothetical protein FGSG_03673 [Fusarium graminearum PH-1]EYB32789.1 hypothetical protein FG05_03673 [Fusarium graminearum]ESU09524.1 hypothetical protein FGSG_03673 [Fusarium graminearum PH-1]KAI6774285.1 hypothetical protein HG531_001134 [Fusarium graminearum]CAF3469817.1 unnamed protein product [Fusarium graminearum]CAF3504255.1 unnamed protein product [Fusarium graminearum]|eukprot:XP_011322023.1 hypothetical protein FGSG_03673 [Fusarium graminearum PH-1]
MRFSIIIIAALLPFAFSKVTYNKWKGYSIEASDLSQDDVTKLLSGIHHIPLGEHQDTIEVAVHPTSVHNFEGLALKSTLFIEDMAEEFAKEGNFEDLTAARTHDRVKLAQPDKSYFKSYHSFEQHTQFLKDLQSSFSKNSEVFSTGKSVEGRDVQGIHLWGKSGKGKKPAIIWHGNVHAREWISSMTVEYLAWKLVQGYHDKNKLSLSIIDTHDFYILPIVNPDGFVYTTKSDRLWRKNRQSTPYKKCVGTDMNRNWPYKWDIPGGSSTDPCEETYRGVKPGDTPEIKALTNHTMAISQKTGISSYIDWHSYSQLILLPYGYTCDQNATNIDYQMELAGEVASAIEDYEGTYFDYGPTCQTIYQTSGGSSDWVYDVAEAELAWGIELRPARLRGDGFVLPPKNIIASGEEIWAGMQVLFKNLVEKDK